MPRIRPETDLKNCYEEISNYCHEKKEPVFITQNGHGDLAVMSMEVYELLVQSMDIFRLDRLMHEGKVAEVGDAMQRISSAGPGRAYRNQAVHSAPADDSKNNVHEILDAFQRNQEEDMGQGEDAGSGAREFLFRGSMNQSRKEVPPAIQKIRQDFVKPQE
jgi:PHD/YefM family antitoxin component YafN of YafNO toxin-antitoxin module